jgi:DNA-binding IclR family transcriptional regulator
LPPCAAIRCRSIQDSTSFSNFNIAALRFASEALAPLAEETGLAALITVLGTNGPTVTRCEQAELASAVRVREGRNLSMLHSASGRVFLTYLPEAQLAPFVAHEREGCRGERITTRSSI